MSAAAAGSASDLASLRSQLEFYFSDANLRRDGFLAGEIDNSIDGYVDLEVLLSFNKIKSTGATIEQLATCLGQSKSLMLDETRKRVRRITPIAKLDEDTINARTLYLEGFPQNSTHDDIRKWLQQAAPVAFVTVPFFPGTKTHKGYAFVEFVGDEGVSLAMELISSKQAGSHELPSDLRAMSQIEWRKLKKLYRKLYDDTRAPPKNSQSQAVKDTPLGDQHTLDLNSSKDKCFTGVVAEVLHVPGNLTRGQLREKIEAFASLAYLDFRKGSTKGFVRFRTPADLDKVCGAFPVTSVQDFNSVADALEGPLSIRKLSRNEELEYLTKNGIIKHPKEVGDTSKISTDLEEISNSTPINPHGDQPSSKRQRKTADRVHLRFN